MDLILCTLWDKYAEKFSSGIGKVARNELVVVIIHIGRIRKWQYKSFKCNIQWFF